MTQDWIKIEDDLPPINFDVLTFSCMNGFVIGVWHGEDIGWLDTDECEYEPTHWCYLYEPIDGMN
jgi:hypothetical protein